MDIDRVQRDNKIFKEFAHQIFTWSNYKEYESKRLLATYKYHVLVRSQFLHTYMPYVREISSKDGHKYNKIDAYNLNSSFESNDSYLLGFEDTKQGKIYNYASVVTISSKTEYNATGKATTLVMYSTNDVGWIYDIAAYDLGVYNKYEEK